MSKPVKSPEPVKLEALPFEEALSKLEGVVESMEAGDLPLEALLARYEEGMKLARVCQGKLAEAEVRLQQLESSAEGLLALKPVATDSQDD